MATVEKAMWGGRRVIPAHRALMRCLGFIRESRKATGDS